MPEAAIHLGSGKVRELYALDDERLLLVASDRISTFDVILPTEIPDKGRVLTGLSAFWFARTQELVPNHLLALRNDGRSLECRRLEMLPVEIVVRGYLSGSGWKDYSSTGVVCGHELPTGLRESDRLPEPIVTPATKAQSGHDENIDWQHRRRPRRARALGEGGVRRARPLPLRRRARRGARNHPRRHEVRARDRPRRRAGARGRGADAGLLPLLARGRLRTRWPAALVRQAVRARLLPRASAGTRPIPAPRSRPTSSPAHAPVTSRRSSC